MVADPKFVSQILHHAKNGDWSKINAKLKARPAITEILNKYDVVFFTSGDEDRDKCVYKLQIDGSTRYIMKTISKSVIDEAKGEIMAGVIASVAISETVVPILNVVYAFETFHIFTRI